MILMVIQITNGFEDVGESIDSTVRMKFIDLECLIITIR